MQPEKVAIEFLTIPETAKFLRISKNTLYGLVVNKRLDYYKVIPGKIFFKRADLETLIENSKVSANGQR